MKLLSLDGSAMIHLYLLLFCILALVHQDAFCFQSVRGSSRCDLNLRALSIGEYNCDAVAFTAVEQMSENFGLYKLQATISKDAMKAFLQEYKAGIKARGVKFPGFRLGNMPPQVMVDVRKYLVNYGVESMLGEICNINGLEMRDKAQVSCRSV